MVIDSLVLNLQFAHDGFVLDRIRERNVDSPSQERLRPIWQGDWIKWFCKLLVFLLKLELERGNLAVSFVVDVASTHIDSYFFLFTLYSSLSVLFIGLKITGSRYGRRLWLEADPWRCVQTSSQSHDVCSLCRNRSSIGVGFLLCDPVYDLWTGMDRTCQYHDRDHFHLRLYFHDLGLFQFKSVCSIWREGLGPSHDLDSLVLAGCCGLGDKLEQCGGDLLYQLPCHSLWNHDCTLGHLDVYRAAGMLLLVLNLMIHQVPLIRSSRGLF